MIQEPNYKVTSSLPTIPDNADKDEVKRLLTSFALDNKFVLVINKSDPRRLIFTCKKGGHYSDWRHLDSLNIRKRNRVSNKTGCTYVVRLSRRKGKGFQLLPPKNDTESYHNHPLDQDDFMSMYEGRINSLTEGDIKTLSDGIKKNLPTETIQNNISVDKKTKALKRYDINNLRHKHSPYDFKSRPM